MSKIYSGLQKAIRAADDVAPEGSDGVALIASFLNVKRKTLLGWLREDGTPLGAMRELPNNKVTEATEKAGGVSALARVLGVTPTAVREWVNFGYVPTARAQQIEILYGIPRTELVSPKVRSAMGIGGEL